MKNIKIMRLVTGEDIIGNISESQGLITIKKAFVIIPMQNPLQICPSAPGTPQVDILYKINIESIANLSVTA